MDSELIFRVIVAIILIAFVLHRGYYSRKYPPLEEATLESQTTTPLSRVAAVVSLLALISTAIYIVYPTAIAWSSLSLPPWVRLLGGVFALLGFALMQWAQNALGRNWSDQPRIIEDQRLISTGPYRWFRHPMYTAFLLILGPTLLISANWLVGGLWILMT